jgi:D-glycero-D-manno-heptose 1,7-bisphosphate phosphatase
LALFGIQSCASANGNQVVIFSVTKAVFLDRDGVINRSLIHNGKPFAPTNLNDFQILPGVIESLFSLKASGYLTVVVTNQPDLSNGKQTWEGHGSKNDFS